MGRPARKRTGGDRPVMLSAMQIEELAMDARKADRIAKMNARLAAELAAAGAAEDAAEEETRKEVEKESAALVAVEKAAVEKEALTLAATGSSVGCITAAAGRLGIQNIGFPIRQATATEAANMAANLAKEADSSANSDSLVGPCSYNRPGSFLCSYISLPLIPCGFENCKYKVHHLCQIEWEIRENYEEAEGKRCAVHHPRVIKIPLFPPIDVEELSIPCSVEFEGRGRQGGDNSVGGVEEDVGVDGSELPALGSVFECDHINPKILDGKDGWECRWCGHFFSPWHSARASKHVLKIKGGYCYLQGNYPPSVPCSISSIAWSPYRAQSIE